MKMDISASQRSMLDKQERKRMPDVTNNLQPKAESTLDCVGMRGIEIPVLVKIQEGVLQSFPAKATFYVSLDDPAAKGIHMSRLYLAGQKILADRELNFSSIKDLLNIFIDTHKDLSKNAVIRIAFDYAIKKPALLSDNEGWRYYPVVFDGRLIDGKFIFDLTVTITYSSTCPCSAALTRQLIQKQFEENFDGQDVVSAADVYEWLGREGALAATPHSQRSNAIVKMRFIDADDAFDLEKAIGLIENALKTPVQTAVKRQDEQEFARLNGENLMFCEDAARILKTTLDEQDNIADYRIEVEHLESLHAHDAVAITTKGIENGFCA